ncbi:Tn3 family transposase [Streptomyces sp. NPDC093097]|uniref:Tn3 family transposase n=1 Tax=Streptomyces sp. NPDC093097 TaxID=3366027 RepID=UPI0037F29980
MTAPLGGLTHRLTGASALLGWNCRPSGRCRPARGRSGDCDLIGARPKVPSLSCPSARPALLSQSKRWRGEQEKAAKFNALLTSAVIFHSALDIAEIVRRLLEEGWTIEPEDLAHVSPCLAEHINRFGEYSTHELGIQPGPYEMKPEVDVAQLCDQDLAAGGFRTAA